MYSTQQDSPCLSLHLGTPPAPAWSTGLPVLAGESSESLFPSASPVGHYGHFSLFEADGFTLGAAFGATEGDLTENAFRLYLDLFRASRGKHLCRIWNYVPGINGRDASGLEHYQAFCKGRSLAFEARYGAAFTPALPSASAVGTDAGRLLVVFAAHPQAPEHRENPLQLPAYQYPAAYGPRPPSFARASIVDTGSRRHVFVSGTASIRGHETVAAGDLGGQLDCTLENLRVILERCDLRPDTPAVPGMQRHIKVYVRNPGDAGPVMERLNRELLHPGDRVSCLRSDICRADLAVEIELSILNAPGR
jgi:enamine deaminase RidA (YjgF/YER057c/UK114 family)